MPLVSNLDEDVLGLAGDSRSALGTGGMRSKLQAARLVTQAGGSVVIASGKKAEPLTRILRARRSARCSSPTARLDAHANAGSA